MTNPVNIKINRLAKEQKISVVTISLADAGVFVSDIKDGLLNNSIDVDFAYIVALLTNYLPNQKAIIIRENEENIIAIIRSFLELDLPCSLEQSKIVISCLLHSFYTCPLGRCETILSYCDSIKNMDEVDMSLAIDRLKKIATTRTEVGAQLLAKIPLNCSQELENAVDFINPFSEVNAERLIDEFLSSLEETQDVESRTSLENNYAVLINDLNIATSKIGEPFADPDVTRYAANLGYDELMSLCKKPLGTLGARGAIIRARSLII